VTAHSARASTLLVVALAALFLAGSTMPPKGSPSAASSRGSGAEPGVSEPGFDVTGSHPLPNADEHEPPGRGACGCATVGTRRDETSTAGVLVIALFAMRAARRRTVAR
jgi:hypothetical protein